MRSDSSGSVSGCGAGARAARGGAAAHPLEQLLGLLQRVEAQLHAAAAAARVDADVGPERGRELVGERVQRGLLVRVQDDRAPLPATRACGLSAAGARLGLA